MMSDETKSISRESMDRLLELTSKHMSAGRAIRDLSDAPDFHLRRAEFEDLDLRRIAAQTEVEAYMDEIGWAR